MKKNHLSIGMIPVVAAMLFLLSAVAQGQDFQKSYQLGPGGHFSISSVAGNIRITGYDGNEIVVNGIKEGRDRDLVTVVDSSSGNSVELKVRYPQNCNCDASIRFEVQVPQSLNLDFDQISSASGDIEVSGVSGQVKAKSASGNVEVNNITGSVNASAASGDVKVKNINGTVSAHSASGNVEVEITQLSGNDA